MVDYRQQPVHIGSTVVGSMDHFMKEWKEFVTDKEYPLSDTSYRLYLGLSNAYRGLKKREEASGGLKSPEPNTHRTDMLQGMASNSIQAMHEIILQLQQSVSEEWQQGIKGPGPEYSEDGISPVWKALNAARQDIERANEELGPWLAEQPAPACHRY